MDEKIKNVSNQAETKHKKQVDDHNKKIKSLQHRVRDQMGPFYITVYIQVTIQ
jgi:polyhydroxyalkanoate synthesis regulator phasin